MAEEDDYPKSDGDVGYSSEINKIKYDLVGEAICGDGSDGALAVASGTTTITDAVKRYTSLSVSNGATLAFSGKGKYVIYVQGDITLTGAVTINDKVGSSPTYLDATDAADLADNITTGGSPGAIVPEIFSTFAGIFKKHGFLPESSDGGKGSTKDGVGVATGGGGGGSAFVLGGDGSDPESGALGGSAATGGAGGNGKASVLFICEGTVTINSTFTFAGNGNDGSDGSVGSIESAGGGGGGAAAIIGFFSKRSITTIAGAVFNITGGDGGDGGNNYRDGGGGGGGAGGALVMIANDTVTHNATVNKAGGAVGALGSGGSAGTTGVEFTLDKFTIT